MGPFFSIIIPVYNGEQCIGQCLDSIYAQGLLEDDFEVICVNDASTDNKYIKSNFRVWPVS